MWRKVLAWLLVGLVLLPPASAQDAPQTFKPEELDQLVAPIALHPDALVAQILMASTYPLEVVQAARFVQDKPGLKDDQLNDALKQYPWDDSVKSLVFFPQVLTMMNDKLDWLQKLGDAVLGQQQDVMAAVQRLRARAQAAGQLQSTPEQQVIVEPSASPPTAPPPPPVGAPPPAPPAGAAPPPASTTVEVTQASPTVIRIEPTNPEVIYVPSYNPTVVYGAWPYPAYPPYYPYPVGAFAAGAFTFAAGAAVGAALWGGCDWHGGGGEININSSRSTNFTTNVNNRTEASKRVENYRNSGQAGQARQTGQAGQARQAGQGGQNRGQWQHNPEHRKGVQYRDTATQQRYNKTGPANAQSREAFRGHAQQGTGAGTGAARTAQSGGSPQAGTRERSGGHQPSASVGDRAAQASPRSGGAAHSGAAQGGGGHARQAGAFEGMGSGHNAQSFSDRGHASRQSFNASTAHGNRGAASGARTGGSGGRAGGGGGRGGGRR